LFSLDVFHAKKKKLENIEVPLTLMRSPASRLQVLHSSWSYDCKVISEILRPHILVASYIVIPVTFGRCQD